MIFIILTIVGILSCFVIVPFGRLQLQKCRGKLPSGGTASQVSILFDNGLIFMSQVSLLIPIFGLYFSWLFLSEKFTANMLISLLIILFGLWVLQLGYKKSNS